MTVECPHCHAINPDDTLWCKACNKKISSELLVYSQDVKLPPYSIKPEKEKITFQHKTISPSKRMFRTLLYLLIFAIVFVILIVVVLFFSPLQANLSFSLIGTTSFHDDYGFHGSWLNTTDGWAFTITPLQDFKMTARVLFIEYYSKSSLPYRPINSFSPVDVVLGIDDIVENPEEYPYRITSSYDREVRWYIDGSPTAYQYFLSHTGNHHIIPHNEEVYSYLIHTLQIDDVITIEGTLVNLYGIKGEQYYRWETDTSIGNYPCEIILVEKITRA